MKIGDTLYRFYGNSRIYRSGKIVYRDYFHPVKIIGETSRSWIMDWYGEKVDKKTLKGSAASYQFGSRGYFTAEAIDIWANEHRSAIYHHRSSAACSLGVDRVSAAMGRIELIRITPAGRLALEKSGGER